MINYEEINEEIINEKIKISKKHYETHLYGFAVAFLQKQKNADAMREKAIKNGHTEGECQMVEKNPKEYIKNGFRNLDKFK